MINRRTENVNVIIIVLSTYADEFHTLKATTLFVAAFKIAAVLTSPHSHI